MEGTRKANKYCNLTYDVSLLYLQIVEIEALFIISVFFIYLLSQCHSSLLDEIDYFASL